MAALQASLGSSLRSNAVNSLPYVYRSTALQPVSIKSHWPTRPRIANLLGHGGDRCSIHMHKSDTHVKSKRGVKLGLEQAMDGEVKPRAQKGLTTTTTTTTAATPKADVENPFDMADLQHAWKETGSRFGERLRQLRTGGRFSPEFLGAVPVRPDRKSAATVPLSEVAVVVPKGGRRYGILCAEARHKAAIKSAVQASPHFNQQPQDSPDDELELLVLVEPERAADLSRRVGETCMRWREAIRTARSSRDKTHKLWQASKRIRIDDKRKLDKELQKLQDAQMDEVKKMEAEALAAIKTTAI